MSNKPSLGSDYAKGTAAAARGLGLAFGFVGITMACFFLGRWADSTLGTEPIIQVIGAVVGFVLGFVAVYYGAQREADR
jgi:F0F1-type ATP synthase assembly protein I